MKRKIIVPLLGILGVGMLFVRHFAHAKNLSLSFKHEGNVRIDTFPRCEDCAAFHRNVKYYPRRCYCHMQEQERSYVNANDAACEYFISGERFTVDSFGNIKPRNHG